MKLSKRVMTKGALRENNVMQNGERRRKQRKGGRSKIQRERERERER